MNSRSKYRTKQREILLEYFRTCPGVHVTAADICGALSSRGARIGQSTVYRNLEALVQEGTVKKYVIDGNSPACFEYVEPESHCESGVCYHLKCEKCGRLIHLDCEELKETQLHMLEEHGFRMDPARTVFYGICSDCL